MTSVADQIAAVDLSVLPLASKVRLLTGASAFTLQASPEVGLASMAFSDGPTGVRGLVFHGGEKVALFPNATVLASSWDEGLLERVGVLLAEEAERQHIHTVLGPTINLHRSPLGGRLFEQFSEDPLLTGRLAAAYVRGMQSRDVAACLKHFVANESETLRNFVNAVVDEATLREVYLLPFEIALDAQPWSIMAAYNRVNGVSATEHELLNTELLKGEWAYDGLLMSDWLATKTTAESANGGLDLVMPGPDGPWGDALVAAVEAGEVGEDVIDDKVRRLLLLAARTGAWGSEPRPWTPGPLPTASERRSQLTELAAAGFTVLRNDGVLPLAPDQRLALIGRPAAQTACMGGGSARVQAPHQISIVEGLRAAGVQPAVVDGWDVRERPLPAAGSAIRWEGRPGMGAEILDAAGQVMQTRHLDEGETGVGEDDVTPRPVAKGVLHAVTEIDGPQQIGFMGTGRWTLTAGEQRFEALLQVEGNDPGEGIFKSPYRIFDVDLPRGTELRAEVDIKPAEGVLVHRSGVAALDDAIAGGGGPKTLVVRPAPALRDEILDAAVAAAGAAETAVVCVGLTDEQETESSDKTTLVLPADQDRLVEAVAAVAPRTVVVVNAATPVLMPWADHVDAIMVIGLPGQEGGHAVARTLLGELEPSGRLVTTWPATDGASPGWCVTPDSNHDLRYLEGRYLGHRGHAPFGLAAAPAYWFGEGLGYGRWEYADAHVDGREVSVTIRNIGAHRSREVVQAYFAPAEGAEPIRLVGWAAETVDPGAEARVTVRCDERLWRRWDARTHRWAGLSGEGVLLLARGLGDPRCRLVLGPHAG